MRVLFFPSHTKIQCTQQHNSTREHVPCLQTLAGSPQSRLGLQSPAEGGQAGGTPQLVSQAHLVFAQPLEELNPSDTEQEKVPPTIHRPAQQFRLSKESHLFTCSGTYRVYSLPAGFDVL